MFLEPGDPPHSDLLEIKVQARWIGRGVGQPGTNGRAKVEWFPGSADTEVLLTVLIPAVRFPPSPLERAVAGAKFTWRSCQK